LTLSRSEILGSLASHGIHPSRALGQNFVADANTVRRIARLAEIGPGDRVLEIGAGLGCLTLALLETGAEVTAVEVDRHLVPLLRANVESSGARVVEGDAMGLDWKGVLGLGSVPDANWHLVANLPYNVATPLIADLLDGVKEITAFLVMVQREVGERLVAGPGDKGYGAVSVKVAYWAEGRVLGKVPASVFVPRPNVESVLVRLVRRTRPAVDPAAVSARRIFELTRAGFAHRRKMLRGSLAGLVTAESFAEAGVDPRLRAEDLDVVSWGRLAMAVERVG
jgi:16S rRNA (adenine1518-N6/adenine1519-N6)-dimethyltransferase